MLYLTERVRMIPELIWRAVVLPALILLLGLFSLPANTYALGFGTLILQSYLHESLKADVPLMLNATDDIDGVRVELASPLEYRQLGLQWRDDLVAIRVFIQNRHSAHPSIELRSSALLQAPMLSIVLKANQPGQGTYFRHFQLLLDPRESNLRESDSSKRVALKTQRPSLIALPSQPSESPVDITLPVVEDDSWARTWRYGPVRSGDSLSEIAYRLRKDKRYSNKQVMLSLYEKNRHGFVDGDINQLKKGVWLTVPRGDVVKAYGSAAALLKLTRLLERPKLDESVQSIVQANAKKADSENIASAALARPNPVIKPAATGLRYSGKISLNTATARKVVSQLEDKLDQQLLSIHQQMMDGKLQMTDLGDSVASLNESVQGIQQDMHVLKNDVAIIKARSLQQSPQAVGLNHWQLAFFALLAALLGALLTIIVRKKPEPETLATVAEKTSLQQSVDEGVVSEQVVSEQIVSEYSAGEQAGSGQEAIDEDPFEGEEAEASPLADEVVQLLNQAEESLGKCEFSETEQILARIETVAPSSLRAMVLKAQLLHETGRHRERNVLINSISESSNKNRWEQFCQLLPAHVWNACFGDALGDMPESENRTATEPENTLVLTLDKDKP